MDFKALLETVLSLTILVFVLAGLRKVLMFFAGKFNLTGITTFLA